MNILLILLICACTLMEFSPKVPTDNILEKFGVGLIVLGAVLSLAGKQSILILLGATIYFVTLTCRAYIAKHNRRKIDHIPKKRKLLS